MQELVFCRHGGKAVFVVIRGVNGIICVKHLALVIKGSGLSVLQTWCGGRIILQLETPQRAKCISGCAVKVGRTGALCKKYGRWYYPQSKAHEMETSVMFSFATLCVE
jgi:hypothetical protein